MHSSKALRNDQFTFARDGQPTSFAAILPDFRPGSRLGIVSRPPGGALGASVLLMAAITAFYDAARAEGCRSSATPITYTPITYVFSRWNSMGGLVSI